MVAVHRLPHGGGTRGRKDCPCELCVEQYRKYNRDYHRNRKAALRPSGQVLTKEDMKVPHGGGKKGRTGCDCEPCKERRRRYSREYLQQWRKQQKEKGMKRKKDPT